MNWKPYNWQIKAAKFMLTRGEAGLWLDPGLGKTSITLAVLEAMRQARKLDTANYRALIIAPLRVAQITWPEELRKWDEFADLSYKVFHGHKKEQAFDLPAHINIVNPEGLRWLFDLALKRRHWPWKYLIVDESTKFKHHNAQRTKLLKQHLNNLGRASWRERV